LIECFPSLPMTGDPERFTCHWLRFLGICGFKLLAAGIDRSRSLA